MEGLGAGTLMESCLEGEHVKLDNTSLTARDTTFSKRRLDYTMVTQCLPLHKRASLGVLSTSLSALISSQFSKLISTSLSAPSISLSSTFSLFSFSFCIFS